MQPFATIVSRLFPQNTSSPANSLTIMQLNAQQIPNSNQSTTCSIPVKPFSATTIIAPHFVTTAVHPTYGHTAPIPLCWGGPQHPTPPAPAPENAILIKEFADAITKKRNDPLPKWKLSQYIGDPLQWQDKNFQSKNAIDSQSLTDDTQLTYLKTLVTGKAKRVIDGLPTSAQCTKLQTYRSYHQIWRSHGHPLLSKRIEWKLLFWTSMTG